MTPSHHDTDLNEQGGLGEVSDDEVLSGLIGRLGSDTLRYIPAVIVPAVLSVLHIAIFTRVFAPGPYGQYSLVYVVVTITTSVLSGWLQQAVLRYLPRYRREGRVQEFHAKVGAFLWMTVLLVLVVALAAHWLVRPLLGEYARYYFPALVWVIAWVFFFVQNHALRADLRSARFARYQILYAVGRLAFSLGFVFLISRDVIGMIVGATVAYLVLLWPMQVELGLLRRPLGVRLAIDMPLLREFVRYGFPLIGWVLGAKILDLSDRFIIELFRDSEEVGIYSANFNLVSMGILFVATPLLSAALPLIVNAWEQGHRSRIQNVISNFSRYYLLSAVPLVAFTVVFSREIAGVFLGEGFREGYRIMPFVLASALVWNFAMYGHKGIKLLEKTRVMLVLVIICCVTNIGLNLIFVPRYGYFGAAVTTMASHALYPVMVYFVTRRYLEWIIPWRSVLNIMVAGAVASAGWWAARSILEGRVHILLVLAFALVFGMLVYVAVLAVMRELRDYEKRLITFKRSD